MRREQATARLVRMVQAVRSGCLPARVRELYVFGSYARGAPEPGDLDVVVVHDRPAKGYEDTVREHFETKGLGIVEQIVKSAARFQADMRRPLRKPGEKADILLVSKLDEILGQNSKIQRSDLILLWSETDPDYQPKLDAIRLNARSGRAPRDHIISLKRLSDHVETMDTVVAMIRDGELSLTRLPIAGINGRLNAHNAHWLDWWTHCRVMGKESLRLLPYAMWWLEQHRQRAGLPRELEVWSKSRTHRVHLGRPSLIWMLGEFKESARLRRQCLIPHFKASQPNELLVFERGPKWSR
jgi:predicted nucleotidyltransferase